MGCQEANCHPGTAANPGGGRQDPAPVHGHCKVKQPDASNPDSDVEVTDLSVRNDCLYAMHCNSQNQFICFTPSILSSKSKTLHSLLLTRKQSTNLFRSEPNALCGARGPQPNPANPNESNLQKAARLRAATNAHLCLSAKQKAKHKIEENQNNAGRAPLKVL